MTTVGPIPSPQVRLTFTGIPNSTVKTTARVLMASLEQETSIIDPVVSASPGQGELIVSFELTAVPGGLDAEVAGALAAIHGAVDRASLQGIAPQRLANPSRFEVSRPR